MTSFPQTNTVPPPVHTRPGLTAGFTAVRFLLRARKLLGQLIGSLISLFIWALFLAYAFTQGQMTVRSPYFIFMMVGLTYILLRGAWVVVKMIKARRAAKNGHFGPVFEINPTGMVLLNTGQPQMIPWDQMRVVHCYTGRFFPEVWLAIEWGENRAWKMPLAAVDTEPQDLDSAFRAFSRGRFGLDLTRVNEIW